MPKRSSKKPKREDEAQAAVRIIAVIAERSEATAKPKRKKNPAAVALGRLGGLKGGKARAEKLTAEERTKIARVAAAARWKRKA
jgi:hypothetical protein